ncbi:MAG: alpha-2-macroglobulin [Gammaproteobacteria bacterium]
MSATSPLISRVFGILNALPPLLRRLSRAVLGNVQWQAPPWFSLLSRHLRTGVANAAAHVRQRPRQTAVTLMSFIIVVTGGYAAWRWYESRPKPIQTSFSVTPPATPCYGCDWKPALLVVRFESSSAPIDRVDKDLERTTDAIQISPAVKGVWHWAGDQTLSFKPDDEWPIDTKFRVNLAQGGLVAGHVHLDKYSFDFKSAAFDASITNSEFYQDPTAATVKKAVVTVAFTHPVDTARFEKHVSLEVFERITDSIEEDRGPAKFTVIYDKLQRTAFIHSTELAVPNKAARLAITVAEGVRAARGGNETELPLRRDIAVPGLYSLAVQQFNLQVTRDEHGEPSQALLLELNHSVLENDLPPRIHAWRLPAKHPDPVRQAQWRGGGGGGGARPYPWSEQTASKDILKVSTPLPLAHVAGDRDHYELHSFRVEAQPGEYLYVRVDKGLKSFGGYVLGDTVERVLRVPEYPRELKIAHEGALLPLSGKKTITVMTRDVPAIHVDIGRLLPRQIQHLVTQANGGFAAPYFSSGSFDAENLTERFTTTIKLPKTKGGKASYQALPLESYLADDAADRRGVFFLKVQAWDTEHDQPLSPGHEDSRLVVITDLGLLAKTSIDGSREVFVQSIRTGEPLADTRVEILGRNGIAVLAETTDKDGHVHFPDLRSFKREQSPVLYLARRGGDSSFLPMEGEGRSLDLSRFDVGGVSNRVDQRALSAYLFSDRGLYRPGEEIRIGTILRSQDWKQPTAGIPLRLTAVDPRGVQIRNEVFMPGAAGFGEIRHATRETSPAGTYTFSLMIERRDGGGPIIGSVAVQVRDFLPDRLRMTAHFSAESTAGWVSPQDLKANLTLQNLFGAPAQKRRVAGYVRYSARIPSFTAFPDYQFFDPRVNPLGFDEPISAATDDNGEASVELNLKRFERALYQVHLTVEGFEADGGRGVSTEAVQLVSSLPFILGWKADGALSYVHRGSQHNVEIVAIGPDGKAVEARDLRRERFEQRAVSTLIRQSNGVYKYESRIKSVVLDTSTLSTSTAAAGSGLKLALETGTAGSFLYVVSDAEGQTLARIDYLVAGDANVARTLDKSAQLQIALSREDYSVGEEIEMQIRAPYTGAGLITIERDRVYAWRWFKTSTTSSTQRIRVPAGLEGNAYVHVAFVRDPASDEIYTSPLSYGVQPFAIGLANRRNAVKLEVPALVKPGEALTLRYSTPRPARIAVFAVDEGILQVARYRTPDPLAQFFEKRSLEVGTQQILDLILPEFRQTDAGLAPGGDQESGLGQHLNPFRRKGEKPVTYWSGILDADATERELRYAVPDYFNGTLRVIAVAVSDDTIGVQETRTVSRGDFVLSPNAPTTVTPGDEFEVSLGVSNNLVGSGDKTHIVATLTPDRALEIVGEPNVTLEIAEKHEGVAHFRLRVLDTLGPAFLEFKASSGNTSIRRRIDLSVRPATPYMTTLRAGTLKSRAADVNVERSLYSEHRVLSASISLVPLSLAHGLAAYLGGYPYQCTEQLVSQAVPALVLSGRPEFGYVRAQKGADLAGLVNELRVRQNDDGAYRLWPGGSEVVEFVSVYTQHFLLEATERGEHVPGDVLQRGNLYLRALARRDGNNLTDERNSAYALYLLVRQGQVMSAEASALRTRLTTRYKAQWQQDLAALWLGAAFKLMQQDADAERLIRPLQFGSGAQTDSYSDGMTRDGFLLYVLARHFPDKLRALPPQVLDSLATRIAANTYHSLSAGSTLLGLSAYVSTAKADSAPQLGIASILRKDKSVHSFTLPVQLMPKVPFSEDAAALRFSSGTGLNAYYLLEESGFDRTPPGKAISQGFEIIREYRYGTNNDLQHVPQGETVSVHLKVRAIGLNSYTDVALVDLLPGGFDLVMPPGDVQPTFYSSDGNLSFADPREDRVVFYFSVTPRVQEITYAIKATNIGKYVIPPAYGEAMYDRSVVARSAAGSIQVVAP